MLPRWSRSLLVPLVLCCSAAAQAQNFPAKPLRIVVPFGAGGVADLTARTVAQRLSESLGQPVIIDNKPGAGGVVASDAVAKAAPDGYTLLLMSNANAVSANLFKSLPFDTLRDFVPISTLGNFDIAIVTSAESKFKTLPELLAFAKAHPGQLNIGSINVGSTQNLAAELFKSTSGLDMQIVPFNGSPAVITALRGGQIDAAVEILAPVMAQVNAKAVRVLAVTGDKRSPVLPEVPTAKELGLAGLVAASWNALAAPAKTPLAVIARLNKDLVAALAAPDVQQKLRTLNVTAQSSTPEQAHQLLVGEVKRWGEVIVRAKIPQQ
ncbi:Bug family tripartite tricarboxylate transporter substrate binding protein [Rhodoferax sp.]|uniref:Bug family tripartite tricarboxylate transporter substrate binding protein n=1 Tax=Rhodoferax sp. TaxID=50421 RepID=UPI00374D4158